tara:strand:- start:2364 stop:2585 length:222 start_codon:yes stop_codon:yes gene_type:complete
MVKLNPEDKTLIINLNYKAGRSLAEMVLQSIWTYAAQEPQDRAIIMQMNRMVHGQEPMADVDLMDYTDVEGLQ